MNTSPTAGPVFLSASFPSGIRGEGFRPYDPAEIADAVTAVVRALFNTGVQVLFGGHPTITPLVLFVAAEHGVHQSVEIYQSKWFDLEIPAETIRLQDLGFGRIVWTERGTDVAQSLLTMRTRMLSESRPRAGVFIGGMEGVVDEWDLFGELLPDYPRIPLRGPGGAARTLDAGRGRLPDQLLNDLGSVRYPVIANRIVRYIGDRP